MKFGGTSVGSPESLQLVKSIVENEQEPVIVVVSALNGVTDRLLLAADFAHKTTQGINRSWTKLLSVTKKSLKR